MELSELIEEDQDRIRRAARDRGMCPREFFRLLQVRQADSIAATRAMRELHREYERWQTTPELGAGNKRFIG